MKPGVTVERARADVKAIAARLAEKYPNSNAKQSMTVEPLHEAVVGDMRPALLLLLGAVAFVLLIACANVANLLLARAADRQREIAVRLALGARRGRVLRQLLTESVLLSLLGAAAGVLVGYLGLQALLASLPANVPRADEVRIDLPVLARHRGARGPDGARVRDRPGLARALDEAARAAQGGRPRQRAAPASTACATGS